MQLGSFLRALVTIAVFGSTTVFAQLPSTQLTSVFPPGGKQGTSVEVSVAGADLDDANKVIFNHAGITSAQKMGAATALDPARPVANAFIVTIAAEVTPGIYEARVQGRFGLSNPRAFVVGSSTEAIDTGGNTSAEKALELPLGATVSGRVDASTYDYFRLNLTAGQRVILEVTARRIDSRLDGTLVLLDPSGRELQRAKGGAGADPVLDFTAPADGKYLLKLYDEVYGGGSDYFYRLTASAAPFVAFVFPPSGVAGTSSEYTLYGYHLSGGQPSEFSLARGRPLEAVKVNIPLPADDAAKSRLVLSGSTAPARVWQDGIEYSLPTPQGPANPVSISFAKAANLVVEKEPNNDNKHAQKISVPCELVGQFYAERDFDWYEFEAKKGQTLWIEAISNQLGLASDPFLAIYRVAKSEKGEQLSEIAQVDDAQERGRRNPAADELDVTSDDPSYKLVAPEDGTYRLFVRDQFGDSRQDPSFVYRLAIRTPAPDFRLLAYSSSPPPTQQQQTQTVLSPPSIRRGGTAAFSLVVQRRDEFDGEIAVSVEGLPAGITCPGAVLGGGVTEGSLVLIAADDAPAWSGPIKIVAKAKIGEREVVREARYAVVVWGTANRQQQPAEFRLASGLSLGVVEKEQEAALVRIGEDKVYETSLGGNVEIPIKISRRGDFKDAVKLVAVGLSQQMRPKDVTLDGAKDEAKFELALNQQSVRPGCYTFYMKGETKRKYARNPEAVAAAEAEQKRIAEMLKGIEAEIKSATEAKNEAALKAAQEKLKEANQLKTQWDKRLDDAKKGSQPKDLSVALISTPVKLRIHASPLKLEASPLANPIKAGNKQELTVKLDRLYGFNDQVDVTLEPPAGAQGLSAAKITLKKEEGQSKLEIAAADNATPGQHACTLRARGRFNNVQVESTAQVTVVVEGK